MGERAVVHPEKLVLFLSLLGSLKNLKLCIFVAHIEVDSYDYLLGWEDLVRGHGNPHLYSCLENPMD